MVEESECKSTEIRELKIQDANTLFQILSDSEVVANGATDFAGVHWTLNALQEELQIGFGFGLTLGDSLVAFVLIRAISSETWEVSVLGTSCSHRKKGFMRQLLGSVLQGRNLLGRANPDEIWLEVHAGNQAALSLYRSLGFKQVGTRAGYYRDGGDAILMSLQLQMPR